MCIGVLFIGIKMVDNADRITLLETDLAKLRQDLKDNREASSQWFDQVMKAITDLSVQLGSLSIKEEEKKEDSNGEHWRILMRKGMHPKKRRERARKKKRETRAGMAVISNRLTSGRSICPYSIGKTPMVGSTGWNGTLKSKVSKTPNNSRKEPTEIREDDGSAS